MQIKQENDGHAVIDQRTFSIKEKHDGFVSKPSCFVVAGEGFEPSTSGL